MEYPLDLQHFGITRRISVETGGFFSRAQILVEGNPAAPGPEGGQFVLPRDDGQKVIARLRGFMLDAVPLVVIGDEVIQAAPRFTMTQTLGAALSFIVALSMSIAGLFFLPRLSKTPGIQLMGFLCMTINLFMGVLLGFTSMIINRRILRSEMSRSSQIFSIGAVTIIVIIGFLVVFILLVGILTLFSDLEHRVIG